MPFARLRRIQGFRLAEAVQAANFAAITESVLRRTNSFTAGRTVNVLEGWYNIAALQESVKEHCRALAT